MLFGLIFLIICGATGIAIVMFMESRRFGEGACMGVFWLFLLVPAIAGPLVAEYPSLIMAPTVATFDATGDPVYHKWGLWTPPWRWGTQEVVNVPRGCYPINGQQTYSSRSTLYFYRGVMKSYSVEFKHQVCLENPRKLYSHKHLRRQELETVGIVNTLQDLGFIDAVTTSEANFLALLTDGSRLCEVPPENQNTLGCDAIAKLFEEFQRREFNRVSDYGFVMMTEATVRRHNP